MLIPKKQPKLYQQYFKKIEHAEVMSHKRAQTGDDTVVVVRGIEPVIFICDIYV